MKKRFPAVLTAAVLLLSMTGCGGEEAALQEGVRDTNPDKGLAVMGNHVTYDPNHLVNGGEPVTLDWWLWDAPDLFGSIAREYQEMHPNVTIRIINNPWDGYWTKLPLALQKEEKGPTLFNVHNSYQHLILPYMAPYEIPMEDLTADYFTAASHEIDGAIYYTDFGVMTGAIYYNKDMWEAAGLTDEDIPESWEEFREIAKQLTIWEDGKLVQAGFNYNGEMHTLLLGLPYQLGDTLFLEDGKTADLTSDGMVWAVQMLKDMYDTDRIGDKDFGTDSSQSFGQGQSAMVYKWGHFYGYMGTNYPDIRYGTFEIPTAEPDPFAYDRYNGEATPGINKNASPEQLEAAQDFIRFYLANTRVQKELCMYYSLFPANNQLREDEALQENPAIHAVSEHIEDYIWPGAMPSTMEENLKIAGQDILYNNKDIRKTLQTTEDIVNVDLANTDFTSSEHLYDKYGE